MRNSIYSGTFCSPPMDQPLCRIAAGGGCYHEVEVEQGVLQMDVYLDSVAPTADLFVINGDVVDGPTNIELFNVGGDGAWTGNDQDDGIALVDVSNTGNTADGDFQIVSGVQVDLVYYGQLVLGTDSIWRLQSSYLPTIPVYEVLPSALLNMTQLSSYRERRGRDASMSQDGGPEVWLRIDGKQLERGQEDSTSGTEFEQQHVELVAGVDFQIAEELTAGANLRHATGSVDVSSPHGDSTIDTSGLGIGGTMTWQAAGGTYVDGQARYMVYDSDIGGQGTSSSATGLAASVEVGHKIPIAENWSVSPRGQLSYASVDFDDIAAPHGFEVHQPGRMPFRDQTALFHSADFIVAPHGAALANLMFCRPGTTVLEIFPDNFRDEGFLKLAKAMALNYDFLIVGDGDFRQDFVVGAEVLERKLVGTLEA